MQAMTATADFWLTLKHEAKRIVEQEPLLASFIHACILTHHNFESSLSFILSNKMADDIMPALAIREVFDEAYLLEPAIVEAAIEDIRAIFNRDPAVKDYMTVLIHFKGFQSVQVHRLAHYLWQQKRYQLALFLQSRNSEAFGVDIHPAATIGKGVMFDHATGIVVGETAVIEDNVSILQNVTLGGTGNESGDRHPKIRQGVMLGSGAKVLGNIEIGEGSKVGAGSVVLNDVPPHVTVVGVPAKVVGRPCCSRPCDSMQQNVLEDNQPVD
ncbi:MULTISPECIES: serine O-acetyltransferase [Marisediminitalea]|jgi:serine O-acetyltransferase|uniref:serine O-acetyltransferase n=1 Tax=Marisediminitalea TaxID=2662254 RepID=UPI0020CEC97C|nr:serine O-acetyltransferase [Marisediminitalea aggregata]MCP3862085.1 serine O-acetyltransferase [Aestuariibacter sp.]MCP4232598.1 serine O-acetyltransferase [Aestuariibacter sp.]MCP4529337.1 serine O-acetyltransferase [Aestuariibacter sp.]MCP4946404.1 serine O-acetyltransferase [Aestuariibacter sp.]MCP5008716.1 serine O-acetyltransferase [Aestuariibacter sp.]|tara:strand:+ start:11311 stop:12120 length:810 start_codon:yes stop_codon:yes gene_type:complete